MSEPSLLSWRGAVRGRREKEGTEDRQNEEE